MTCLACKCSPQRGRHASFDVQIRREDRKGSVRPYGSRRVRFLFRPSLAGAFRETLTLQNMQDRSDVQQVTLKAEVKRIDTFQVRAPPLDFAPCACNKPTYDQRRLVLVNTSRGARSYVVEGLSLLRLLDGREAPWWCAAVGLRLEQATADGAEELKKQERQREDVLEKLERKLKIAMPSASSKRSRS
jgi:hypothetical protein